MTNTSVIDTVGEEKYKEIELDAWVGCHDFYSMKIERMRVGLVRSCSNDWRKYGNEDNIPYDTVRTYFYNS